MVMGLGTLHRIALTLWCMDRAFTGLDAIAVTGDEGRRLAVIRSRGLNLWHGSGPAWSAQELESLRQKCEAYDAERLRWHARNDAILNRVFGNSEWVSDDDVTNAITNAVSIVWSLTSVIPDAETDNVIQALEAYYDIFYQPTWERLTAGQREVSPGEMGAAEAKLGDTDPLKKAAAELKMHAARLREMELVSLDDPQLRGAEHGVGTH